MGSVLTLRLVPTNTKTRGSDSGLETPINSSPGWPGMHSLHTAYQQTTKHGALEIFPQPFIFFMGGAVTCCMDIAVIVTFLEG